MYGHLSSSVNSFFGLEPALLAHCCPLILVLDTKLDLQIDPGEVRLRPRPKDKYKWSVAKSMHEDFRPNLSNANLGNLQRICEALEGGNLIEAVHANNPSRYDSVSEVSYLDLSLPLSLIS